LAIDEIFQEIFVETTKELSFLCAMEQRFSYRVYKDEFEEKEQDARASIEEALKQAEGSEVAIAEINDELTIISRVCVYLGIATERIVEVIPMAVELALAKGCVDRLKTGFLSKLGVTEEEGLTRCKDFAREDRAIQEKRDQLKGYIKIAEECLKNSREII
jgi:hypothetical protein